MQTLQHSTEVIVATPTAAIAGAIEEATAAAPNHHPQPPAVAETIVLEGRNREVTVSGSGREPLVSDEDVFLQHGVHLGRLIARYELPFAAEAGDLAADHTLLIFDDSNPNAKHAAPAEYTVMSQRAFEAMSASNLSRRRDEYAHRDIVRVGEGQQLAIGRGERWLPKEARTALKHEPRRVMSDDQAEFRVQNGELLLKANGHNPGFFTAVPNERERAIKAEARALERRMKEQINAGKPTQQFAPVNDERPTAARAINIAVRVGDAYVGTGLHPQARTKRSALHVGSMLRRTRGATRSHAVTGGPHRLHKTAGQ